MSTSKEMQGFKCDIEQECISSKRAKKEYGNWSAEYSNKLNSITIVDNHPDIVAPLNVKDGDQVYVIWCEWHEGDSFGRALNGGYEAVGVFKDSESAAQLARWLDKLHKDYTRDSSVTSKPRKLVTNDGQEFKFESYAPWEGYFEHLNEIHFQMVVVNPSFDFGEDSKIRFG